MYTYNNAVSHFNDNLAEGVVVVALDETYTDNNGPETYAFIFDGTVCERVKYLSGYTQHYTSIDINASEEQIKQAGIAYAHNNPKQSLADMRNLYNSVVILKRSRKARNGVPLQVVNWQEEQYDNRYKQNIPAKVLVEDTETGERVWVSYGCVHKIVRTDFPSWCNVKGNHA